jgi:pyruvate dehydrogenase E1 component alpha subunit
VLATATRYFGHFEGDPQNYRAKDEVKNFRETVDAMKTIREKVTGAGIFTAEELDEIDAEVLALIDSCVESARSGPVPGADIMMSDVYLDY